MSCRMPWGENTKGMQNKNTYGQELAFLGKRKRLHMEVEGHIKAEAYLNNSIKLMSEIILGNLC